MQLRGTVSIAESFPDRYAAEWTERLQKLGISFEDRVVMEIGSGRYARGALRMLAAGAKRVTLVDMDGVPLTHPTHRALLEKDCAQLGIRLDDALSRLELVIGDFTQIVPNPGQHVDLAISNAVLEHVQEPEKILRHCRAWLNPGGFTGHLIDLRDHNLAFRYPFEMLTYSDQVWRRYLDLKGSFHLNRWRAPDYLAALEHVGFARIGYETVETDPQALSQCIDRIIPRFKNASEEQLAILQAFFYAYEPSRP